MIYLSAFLILLSLSSIYLLIGCGGKKEEPKKKKAKASESKSKSSSATGSEEKKEAPSEPPKEPEKKEEEPSAPAPPPDEGEKAPPSAKPKSVKEDKGKPDPNIKISATTLTWDEKAGQQTLKVTNSNETKQAMKMKSSNNVMFKVNPVFAMIDKGKTIDITIMKSPGVLKAEKIQVLTMACDGTDAQKAYAAKDINPAIATIPMVAKKK
ncbi:hypothetical protein Q1695_003796 [Nippostrongylus brasiliensis]|nr:hypothetical protein Q1695_003796 [Nippostrongylus brasiliensis]